MTQFQQSKVGLILQFPNSRGRQMQKNTPPSIKTYWGEKYNAKKFLLGKHQRKSGAKADNVEVAARRQTLQKHQQRCLSGLNTLTPHAACKKRPTYFHCKMYGANKWLLEYDFQVIPTPTEEENNMVRLSAPLPRRSLMPTSIHRRASTVQTEISLTGAWKQLRWRSGGRQGPEDCSRRTDQQLQKRGSGRTCWVEWRGTCSRYRSVNGDVSNWTVECSKRQRTKVPGHSDIDELARVIPIKTSTQ